MVVDLDDLMVFSLTPQVNDFINLLEASILLEIPVTEVRKSWFAKPEISPNGFPTVRVALQELKTVTQLRFFKLQ